MNRLVLMGVLCALTSSVAHAQNETPPTAPLFSYQNPISSEPVRDPQITKIGNEWFMTGTSWPFFEQHGQNAGVKIWKSSNLLDWNFVTMAVLPNQNGWDRGRFWAPEIHALQGKFYLTYNAMNPAEKGAPQNIGLAVADKIEGLYQKLNADKPLCSGNDAHLFQDDDGRVYLFRAGISAAEADLATGKIVGEFFHVISTGEKGTWDGGPGVGIEGPYVIKRNGTYFLFYSSWGRGYEVGYATAKSIHGPWKKAANNPFYGAQKDGWAQHFGNQYTQDASIPWTEVGHGSPFEGPDGKLWLSSHGYKKGSAIWEAHLVIDPLEFDGDTIKSRVPTWTPQNVPLPPK
ncbi:xylan 1,3-beta-xylosidase [Abditibacteriota bacterium]|nr:xylan 1,3-beta-xylosidase [Abditibacteriota bacterium]